MKRQKSSYSLGTLDKNTITQCIAPYLSKRKRGPKPRLETNELVMIIHYRLKTGCQWRELPIKHFAEGTHIGWKSVYYHFRKWCKEGCWKRAWIGMLRRYRSHLDLSSMQIDGSHTHAKGGGEAVGYQGRKAARSTNSLFFADNSGQMIAMSTPQDGSHHDIFEIEKAFREMINQLESAGIDTRGVFLNADAGFDTKEFKSICIQREIESNVKVNPRNTKQRDVSDYHFDEMLYRKRTAVERANAWIDSFKALKLRFEKTISSWMNLHWLAFSTMFINRVNRSIKII